MSQMSGAERLAAIRSEAGLYRNIGDDVRFLLALLDQSGIQVQIFGPALQTDFEAWQETYPEGAVLTVSDLADHHICQHRAGCSRARMTGHGDTLSENRHCLTDARRTADYAVAINRPLVTCGSCRPKRGA